MMAEDQGKASEVRLLNTRPRERAAALTQSLLQYARRGEPTPQSHGHSVASLEVRSLSLLELVPRQLTVEERQMLTQITECVVVVVVSPTAARLGLAAYRRQQDYNAALPSLSQLPCCWIAVGEATASVLRQAGLSVSVPKCHSNEGMLMMPVINSLTNKDKILIWRGIGGRRLLHNELQSRGVNVLAIALYQRCLPAYQSQDIQSACDWAQWVLMSSGMAFDHWCLLVQELGLRPIDDYQYLVLGQRLADRASSLNLTYYQLDNLDARTIWAALQQSA